MTLTKTQFEFNGYNSETDLNIMMGFVQLPLAPTITENAQDVPAKYGNYFLGNTYTSKAISIPITIWCYSNESEYVETLHNLANVLINDDMDNTAQEFPLVFGFAPELTFWGHFTALPDPEAIETGMFNMSTTLTFTCSDPSAYGDMVTTSLDLEATDVSAAGTTSTPPIIHVTPTKSLQYIGYTISNALGSGYVGLGPDTSDESTTQASKYELALADNLGTLSYWTNDSSAISTITTTGDYTMQGSADSSSSTSVITVSSFGTKVDNSWYGPVLKHDGLTTSLSNWKVDMMIHHKKYSGEHNGRAMGRIEMLLLDPNGKTIARFAIKDQSKGRVPYAYLQICEPGGRFTASDGTHHDFYNGKGPKGAIENSADASVKVKEKVTTGSKTKTEYITAQNDENTSALTNAWLAASIEKSNNTWTWSITQYSLKTGLPYKDASKHLIASGTWTDTTGEYSSNTLSSVGLLMMKYAITEDDADSKITYKDCYLSGTSLKIYSVDSTFDSTTTDDDVAQANDEVIFDSTTHRVLVNGVIKYPTWTSDWPGLSPGNNIINFVTSDPDAVATMDYYPKYK